MIPLASDDNGTRSGKIETNGSYVYETFTITVDPMLLPGFVPAAAGYCTRTFKAELSSAPELAKFLTTVTTWLASEAPLSPSAPEPPERSLPCTIAYRTPAFAEFA